jgi:hypothetical protein
MPRADPRWSSSALRRGDLGVLDVDSRVPDDFDGEDAARFEAIGHLVEEIAARDRRFLEECV